MKAKFRNWRGPAAEALRVISSVSGVSSYLIRSMSREKRIVAARHDAWALMRAQGLSYPEIAMWCGGFNHTTIISALQRRERRILETVELIESREIVADHFQDLRDIAQARRGGVQ